MSRITKVKKHYRTVGNKRVKVKAHRKAAPGQGGVGMGVGRAFKRFARKHNMNDPVYQAHVEGDAAGHYRMPYHNRYPKGKRHSMYHSSYHDEYNNR